MRAISRGLVASVVLALVAIAAGLLRSRPLPVDVAAVRRGRFVLAIEEDGRTRIRERFVLSAPVAGTLRRVTHHAGDEVALDETVAVIRPSAPPLLDARSRREAEERVGAAEAAVRRSQETLERARTALAQDRVDAQRARSLGGEGIIARADLEKAELAVSLREREVAAAEFETQVAGHVLGLARTALARLRDPTGARGGSSEPWELRSPVHGRVLRVLQENEAVVAPGTPLVEIGDPGDLEVVVDLLTADAARVEPGAAVSIERWGGQPVAGRVRLVEPSGFMKVSALGVEEQRVNVVIDPVDPPSGWGAVGDGFRLDARIVLDERPDAIVVPSSALFRADGRWAAWVVEGGRARRRAVDLDERGPRESVVAAGLVPGDSVIVYPGDAVAEGVRVQPRPWDPAA